MTATGSSVSSPSRSGMGPSHTGQHTCNPGCGAIPPPARTAAARYTSAATREATAPTCRHTRAARREAARHRAVTPEEAIGGAPAVAIRAAVTQPRKADKISCRESTLRAQPTAHPPRCDHAGRRLAARHQPFQLRPLLRRQCDPILVHCSHPVLEDLRLAVEIQDTASTCQMKMDDLLGRSPPGA